MRTGRFSASQPPLKEHSRIEFSAAPLQAMAWPPVAAFQQFSPAFEAFVGQSHAEQQDTLLQLRADADALGELLHDGLSQANAYLYGYSDSCLHLARNRSLESALHAAKLALEDELLDHWLRIDPLPAPAVENPAEWLDGLQERVSDNGSVSHPLFQHLALSATYAEMQAFLAYEVVRNEVVDDEVAWLTIGKQGATKASCALNHADECGIASNRAFATRAHTYWLRELVGQLGEDSFARVRAQRPWHTSITSNVFNALATRPGLRFAALGHFIVTESWVQAHFECVLQGLKRLGLESCKRYFWMHSHIDPEHTRELLEGIEVDLDRLSGRELSSVRAGAEIAIASAATAYDHMLAHLRALEVRS
jgi:hypothetical protein